MYYFLDKMLKIILSSKKGKYIIPLLLIACFPVVIHTDEKINPNLPFRKLSSTSNICSKTSSEYSQYYKSGDRTKLSMDEDNTEKYDSYYAKALINIVAQYYEDKKAKLNGGSVEPDSEYKKSIFKYAYRILPLLVVFGIGILSLVAWIVWCVCICKKCSCCYCNQPKCKTPSIVLALIFYAIVSIISIYSLIEQNKLFTGLADLECSVIKFTDEVLDGEKNPYPPFWAGIDKMKKTLDEISGKIDDLKPTTSTNLQTFKNNTDTKKNGFESALKDAGIAINNNYKTTSGDYQLDIAKQFGTFDTSVDPPSSPVDSVCYYWYKEYNSLAERATDGMKDAKDNFDIILDDTAITTSLTNAKTNLENIETEFKALESILSDYINKNADNIDKKGKIVYALFFSLLVIFSVAIIVLMLLLCCCSGKVCTNLTCFQCFFKYFLHVFWNIMALIMFVLFMAGSWFTMAGKIGDDLVNVISFIISEDNLDQDKDTVILGGVKSYMNKCFNGDGNILTELGFDIDKMKSFENLKESKLKIEEIINQFNDKKNKFVYSEYLEEYQKRISYNSPDLELVATSSGITPNSYNFVNLLNEINSHADTNTKNENWDITSTSQELCSSTTPGSKIIYHPKKCYPTFQSWVTSEASISNAANKLNEIKAIIDVAETGINTQLESLNTAYTEFLDAETLNLQNYVDEMKKFTDIVEEYTSEDEEFFSYMNCNFMRANVEVILHYLKNRFGNDFFEAGVYLLIAAFSMPFAISFTTLLIVISNGEIEKNKEAIIKEKERENKKNKILENIKNDETSSIKKADGNMTEKEHLNDKIKQV